MAVDVTLDVIATGYNLSKINSNFQAIDLALQDALSRSGTGPNTMSADLDLNGNDIINANSISTTTLIVDGEQFNTDALIAKGDAATIAVGTVTTGAAGSSVIVTNSGDTHAAVLNFTIPRGNTGATGPGSGDMVASQNLNDVASKPTAFSNIKQTATTSATGVVELATLAEAQAGTGTNLVVTADSLKAIVDIINTTISSSNYVGEISAFFAAPSGPWLKINGTTIGSASSGATNRANADVANLYTHIWNGLSNTNAPIYDSAGVASTRGASAAADFAANKRLALPDTRAMFLRGVDDSRGTDAGRAIGSFQGFMFQDHGHAGYTDVQGNHSHTSYVAVGDNLNDGDKFDASSGNLKYYNGYGTSTNGNHSHNVQTYGANSGTAGGETRPYNISVYYYIRY